MGYKGFDIGLKIDDLEKARSRIEELLGIEMKGWDSHAYGGILYNYESPDIQELLLFQNWNQIDGEWNRHRYDEFDLLIRIDRSSESEPVEEKLIDDPLLGAKILRKSEY